MFGFEAFFSGKREGRMKENRQHSYCSFSAGYEVRVATVLLVLCPVIHLE